MSCVTRPRFLDQDLVYALPMAPRHYSHVMLLPVLSGVSAGHLHPNRIFRVEGASGAAIHPQRRRPVCFLLIAGRGIAPPGISGRVLSRDEIAPLSNIAICEFRV